MHTDLVLTSTSSPTSAVSTGTVLLLQVDLFGLRDFNFTLQCHTKSIMLKVCKNVQIWLTQFQPASLLCHYLATTDIVVLLLHDFLHGSLFFVGDEYESPPLLCLWVLWKLYGLNLQTKKSEFCRSHLQYTHLIPLDADKCFKCTSPKVPKYSSMTSFEVSGLSPPTKIFFTGSFFIAMAFLGSICLPSSLCSFCSRTY